MSIEKFLNIIKLQSSLLNNGSAHPALGKIVAYDQNNFYANVELYPDPLNPDQPTTTGWLPIFSAWVGNGWGLFLAPSIGDIVEVKFQEGSLQNGYIGLRCGQLGQNLSVPSGEAWLVHKSGSYIKMTNDEKIEINSPVEINVVAPVVNVNSESVNLGNLSQAVTSLMNDVAIGVFNSHTHNIVSSGVTAMPNQQLDSTALTTNVKGN
jgi:hypothetical protein